MRCFCAYLATPLYVIGIVMTYLSSSTVFAQNLNFKNYTGEDVLPSSNVYAAFQDSKGFMWFGTDRGVTRFDGYSFTTFSVTDGLSDKEVFDFFEDSSGRLWFETMNGKVSYFKDGVFVNSTVDSTLLPLDSKSYISMMAEDRHGNLWFTTTSHGIVCYHKDKTVTRFFEKNSFFKIHGLFFRPKDGDLYLLTQRGIHSVTVNEKADSILLEKYIDIGKGIDPYRVHEINDPYPKFLPVSDQEILYKDYFKLYRCDLANNRISIPYMTDPSMSIHSISRDDGNIWIGTTHGAILYDEVENKTVRHFLKKSMITDVVKDLEGNYWFTTYGDGIFFCTSLEMFSYTSDNGLVVNKVTCLAKDPKNRIWLGYGRGREDYVGGAISYIEKDKVFKVSLTDQAYFNKLATRNIEFCNGNFWIATSQGIFLIDEKRRDVIVTYGRAVKEYNGYVYYGAGEHMDRLSLAAFARNKIDINARQLDPEVSHWMPERNNYQKPGRVKKFFEDHLKRLWVTTDQDIFRYDRDSFQNVSSAKLQINVAINDMELTADNTIVMATSGEGISFIKDDRNLKSIREDQGLSSNICNAISIDNEGTIWVATNNGLNKIMGYPDKITVDYFNVYDGILSNEVYDVLVSGDTVWVATAKGLNFFDRDRIVKKKMSPRVYIDRVTVRGIPVSNYLLGDLTFEHRQNDVGIKYTGLLFNNGEPLIYRYKLHASDPWRFTKSTAVYLPELPPDEYEFMVSARGRSGQWSRSAIVKFEITQPFWEAAWFIALLVLSSVVLISAAFFWFFKQRQKEIERQHRVTISELKSLRAQMNPHFLFNALNSIQGVLLKQSVEVTQDYLGKFGKLMRTILDHADRSSISIKEELDSITNYLEIEQLRANQFHYHIDIDQSLDIYNREIPAMIVQPFIENSIWHGFAHKDGDKQLLIKVTNGPEEETFIEIVDNGIGRKKAQSLRSSKHKSKGIQLVKERIDILNHKAERKIRIEIIDLEDSLGNHPGTKVIISIPSL